MSPRDVPPVALPERPVDRFKWIATGVLVVLFAWSAWGLELKWSRLPGLPRDIADLLWLMAKNIEFGDTVDLLKAMWESISIAWLGTILAAIFAVPLAFVAAENLVPKPVAWIVRQVLNILRAVPEIVLALIFIPVFGLSPMAGMVAIGIGSIGSLGKLFYEIIEGVQTGPIEAADAVGASGVQRLRWSVLPQVMPELASLILYRFEVNIRASAVMGIVDAGGIGTEISQALKFKDYGTAGLGMIIVIVATIAVDVVSGAVRRRIIAGPDRGVGELPDDVELLPLEIT
jgi:phosphonate transport system permease protein